MENNKLLPDKLLVNIVASHNFSYNFNDIKASTSELNLLFSINNNKGKPSTFFAEKFSCSRSYISQVVSKLEKEELIYREKLPQNNRFYGLYPTEKGVAVFNAYQTKTKEQEDFVYSFVKERCNSDEIETFKKVVDYITQATTLVIQNAISDK